MTVGILAEKPSAARNVAAALGGMSGTFDGEQFVIAHARGHLFEFVDPHRMVTDPALAARYRTWDLAGLPWDPTEFSWELETIDGAGETAADVKRILAGCSELVIATDVDPSGEGGMIAVNAFLQLGLRADVWSRMHFTDEAPASLRTAFTTRRRIPVLTELDEYRKAVYRSKFDFLSIQWTRVATLMARASGSDLVLRQGRLKSAMVRLVGDQKHAYDTYVKRPFFQARFRDENNVMYTAPDEPRFDDGALVPSSYARSAVVADATATKHTAPPKLLDLAGLSTLLAGQGVKAKAVLDAYQAMYEAQVVSYPRTEDKTITPAQFDELAPLVDRIAGVVGINPALLTRREPRATHVKAEGAHGANRPGPVVPVSLSDVENRFGAAGRLIYEAVAKNYLAMLAPDYVYEQQKGHVEAYPEFVGTVNVPVHPGWKAVFDPDAETDEKTPTEDDEEEAENSVGLGREASPFVFEGSNRRPEHPSMKWLMKQLEKRDVGTGATRTSTYSDVTSADAKYPLLVEQARGKLVLAEAGVMSHLLLPGTRIGDLGLTEKVYADMRQIAAGDADADDLLTVIAEWVREDILVMQRNATTMRETLGLKEQQPDPRVTGVWQSAAGGPTQISFNRVWSGHLLTDDECRRLLAGEAITVTAMSSKTGRPFTVTGTLEAGMFKGKPFVGFRMQTPDGPVSWCGHTFSADQRDRLEAGEQIEGVFASPKTGKPFRCLVSWDQKARKIVPTFPKTKAKR